MIAFLKENAGDSGLTQIKANSLSPLTHLQVYSGAHQMGSWFTLISIPPFTSEKKLLKDIIENYYAD